MWPFYHINDVAALTGSSYEKAYGCFAGKKTYWP